MKRNVHGAAKLVDGVNKKKQSIGDRVSISG